jgi:hypothetical protein
MKIENKDYKPTRGKRCVLPFTVTAACPECGLEITKDLTGWSEKHVPINIPFGVVFRHEDTSTCTMADLEWSECLILKPSGDLSAVPKSYWETT